MKPVLFVAADARECSPWVSHWDDVRPTEFAAPVHWARRGKWRGAEMIAIANGMGANRAGAAVRAVAEARGVCNIGFCGALDKNLGIGDVFIGNEVTDGIRSWTARRPQGPEAASGRVVSIDRVAQTAREKSDLRTSGASVVEMEAAGVARASEELNIPFYCVRVVSDLAAEDFANDYNRVRLPDGTFSVSRLVLGALGSPRRRFAELIRLSSRTALASKKLGDFLANCTF
jgi:adenosylhomocysteine nucleosidase